MERCRDPRQSRGLAERATAIPDRPSQIGPDANQENNGFEPVDFANGVH